MPHDDPLLERARALSIDPDAPPEEQQGDMYQERLYRAATNGLHNGVHAPHSGPAEPEPAVEIHPEDVATIDDLIRTGSQVRWLWPGWIPCGVLTAIAAEGGTGKTRFCADLLRRIRHQLPWPDGEPMSLPADSLALWVVADNHHDEMVTLARSFDIVPAIRLNAPKSDPYAGVTLETAEDLGALDGRIRAIKPAFVVVDTVGNATDRNLSRQEDAKAFYFPLQVMARRYSCAILCLTHLNATGHFLGRRVLEKVRVAIRMDKPDPGDERRSLAVIKSNSKKPASLGVKMGDLGNDYDEDPPTAPEGYEPGMPKPAPSVDRCCEWLKAHLDHGPRRVHLLRQDAEEAGYSTKTLYLARQRLNAEEFEAEGRKWWRLAVEKCPFES